MRERGTPLRAEDGRRGAAGGGHPGPAAADEGLKSLAKVMRVLDCFSTSDRSLPLADICQAAGLPKSTAHRLLGAMRAAGLVEQDGEGERYRLGLRLFELGNMVLANMDLHREARLHLDGLLRLSRQVVHLAVFDGRQAVVIHRAEPRRTGTPIAYLEPSPIHCTGVGKSILAHQPGPVIARALAGPLRRYTDTTLTDPAALRAELHRIVEQGYAVDEAEHQPGLRCVAAPIRNASGQVFASLSVSAPAWKLPLTEVEPMAKLVCHAAKSISAGLGYQRD